MHHIVPQNRICWHIFLDWQKVFFKWQHDKQSTVQCLKVRSKQKNRMKQQVQNPQKLCVHMLASVHMHWHKQNAIKNHWLQKKMRTGAWSRELAERTHCERRCVDLRALCVHTRTKKVLATRLRFFMEVFVSTTYYVDDCTVRTIILCIWNCTVQYFFSYPLGSPIWRFQVFWNIVQCSLWNLKMVSLMVFKF